MRGLAGLSQDHLYMALFAPGNDPHMDMAEVYFGERTKGARNKTKPINHGLGYGQSDRAISARNGIPIDVVKAATLKREETYTRLVEWTWEVRAQAERGEFLDNGFGRLMRCDPKRAHTQAPALMGQGCSRDLMCEALLRLVALDPRVTAYLRAVVHDEVVLSVPAEEAEYWRGVLAEAFTFTWRDVPILCDVSQPGADWAACYAGE
jgi:DNA polymerase-1